MDEASIFPLLVTQALELFIFPFISTADYWYDNLKW